MIGLMVVMLMFLFTCGECGFCSLRSWCFSKEWVKLGTKSL